MKDLTSLLLIVPLFSILMVQTVRGQTEDEFRQEFEQYANEHNGDLTATEEYALTRFAQMTAEMVAEEAAWTLLENAFQNGPCLAVKRQLCDAEFEAKLYELAAINTAASAACLAVALAGGGPIAFYVCMAAVATQHGIRLRAASSAHRACYLRARFECLPPPSPFPTPCRLFEGISDTSAAAAAADDMFPSLSVCITEPDDNPCICMPRSPIIIDVAGNGFDLTNVADGVIFNITGFGREPLGWTRADSDDAFLTLDLNANGLIDDGRELFGNFTTQLSPPAGIERNGFAALAVFDNNADSEINSEDAVYSELRLWQDRNHNGVSEPDELHSLEQLGLKTLNLKYKNSKWVDEHGNEFRYRAQVKDAHDTQLGRWAWDVFLVSSRSGLIGGLQWQER